MPNALAQSAPQAEPIPFWWFHGELEAGGRMFLNNPQRNGVNSAGQNSLAKYYEYSTIKPGAFLNGYLSTGSKDGLYQVDVWAKNVGYSDQSYTADLSKAGEQYLSLGYDQTPHIYSTSAQTLYNGVGSNALTLPTGLSNSLYNASGKGNYGSVGSGAFTSTNAANVQALINQNVHTTDIGIKRDTASVEYRYTPTANWDIKADYSDMRRTGTQVDGVVFAWGTSGVRVDAPKPVNDRTQNYGLNGEYAGTSPWDQKFNFKLAYNGSTYSDGYDSYTVENPFCPTGASSATSCARTASTSAPLARMTLPPDNQANGFSGTLGADLPFKSRYMGTMSYSMMRQNEAFVPFTTTSGLTVNGQAANSTSSLPASSLNGAINTLLLNNVVVTQITPDLKSKLSYRYYDFDNNTPSLTFPGTGNTNAWVGADTTVVNNYPSPRSLQASYKKQNAGADLNWHATRQLNLGAGYGFERYDRTFAEVAVTNENSGKIYGDWKPTSWVTARASWIYAARRFDGNYDTYNNVLTNMWVTGGSGGLTPTAGLVSNQAYRNYMYSDRDRNQGKFSFAVDVAPGFTLTPTAGLKYDNYLNNVNLGSLTTSCTGSANCYYAGTYNGVALNGTQPGLKTDNSWNVGLEGSVVVTPSATFMLSYTREYGDKELIWCGSSTASTSGANVSQGFCSAFSNSNTTGTGAPSGSIDARMKDTVDTFIGTLRYAAIPNQLDFTFSYTLSMAKDSTAINPGPFAGYGSGAAGNFNTGQVSLAGGPFPDTKTTFQRFDATANYKFDQDLVQRLGWKGEVSTRLRYAYERTSVTNWQNDMMQTYMYSGANPTLGYQTWMAGNNPNYNVHLLAASLIFKW